MNAGKHFSADQYDDFVNGRLDGGTTASIESHLASGCPACSREIAFTKRLHSAVLATSWPAPSKYVHQSAVRAFRPTREEKHAHIRRLLPLAYGLVVVALALMLIFQPPAARAATIQDVTGDVEVRLAQKADWHLVDDGQPLPSGEEIRTGGDGQANILFKDGSHIHVYTSTLIQIYQVNPSRYRVIQASGNGEYWIENGSTLFLLETPTGMISTSGGHFLVSINSSNSSVLVSVSQGEIDVKVNERMIQVRSGQQALLVLDLIPLVVPYHAPTSTGVPGAISTGIPGQGETQVPLITPSPMDALNATPMPSETQDEQEYDETDETGSLEEPDCDESEETETHEEPDKNEPEETDASEESDSEE